MKIETSNGHLEMTVKVVSNLLLTGNVKCDFKVHKNKSLNQILSSRTNISYYAFILKYVPHFTGGSFCTFPTRFEHCWQRVLEVKQTCAS